MTKTKILNKKNIIGLFTLTLLTFFTLISGASAQTNQGWKHQNLKVKGTWSIEKKADGHYITLSDDFKTKRAPDLKIFFSKSAAGDITGNNAINNAALVAKLSSSKGGQSYKIPASVNINDYQSLIIHCEQYSKLWAATPLK